MGGPLKCEHENLACHNAASDATPPPYYVCVYASQVAMCINANRHKRPNDALLLMWQRIDPAGFHEALRRNNVQTDEEVVKRLVKANKDVAAVVDKSHAVTVTSAEVASCYTGALHELENSALREDEKDLVGAVVRKNYYTSWGTRAEPEMLHHIREHLRIPCHPDPKFYKLHMGDVDGIQWYVGGKIDARGDDGKLLIEIKNRVNRLFYCVPSYEAVQVQTYLQLLDIDEALLVECFKGQGGIVSSNAIHISRDRAFWNKQVVPKLQQFVAFLVQLLRNTALQDKFLQSKRPSAMITQFSA